MAIKLDYANLAVDDEFREKVERELIPLLPLIRNNRQRLEARWERFYRHWNAEFDAPTAGYTGKNKIYLSALRRVIETWTSSLVRGFHQLDNWFDIEPVENVSDYERAAAILGLEEHFIKKVMNVKRENRRAFRQLCTYGTSPIKVAWKDQSQIITARTLVAGTEGSRPVSKTQTKSVKLYYGPTYRTVDLFNFFVWPETAADVQEAKVVFEDMEVDTTHLEEMGSVPIDPKDPSKGTIYHITEDAIFRAPGPDTDRYRTRKSRLQRMGLDSDPSDRWSDLAADRRNLTELYYRADLDGTGEKDWLICVVNDWAVIRIQENPFWSKKRPYLVPRMMPVVNEFYGRGIPEAVERVQTMLNSIANQTIDSLQFELNPVVIVDPARVQYAKSIRYNPGMRWLADPEGIKFTQPTRVADIGLTALQSIQGWMHDYSGANAAQMGVPAVRGRGRAQSTAMGMQSLLQQGEGPIADVLDDLEETLGKPLLEMVYQLSEQFMDTSVTLRILGKGGGPVVLKAVDIDDVVGNYEFKWNTASSMRNRTMLGQQMINFANIARGFPPQVLQSINWRWLCEQVWREGLGLAQSDKLFNTTNTEPSVDPKLEYLLMKENRPVTVSPGDDDYAHLAQHLEDRKDHPEGDVLDRLDEHIGKTILQIKEKEAAQKQQQQMMMMQQMMQQQAGGKGQRPQNQPGLNAASESGLAQGIQPGGME